MAQSNEQSNATVASPALRRGVVVALILVGALVAAMAIAWRGTARPGSVRRRCASDDPALRLMQSAPGAGETRGLKANAEALDVDVTADARGLRAQASDPDAPGAVSRRETRRVRRQAARMEAAVGNDRSLPSRAETRALDRQLRKDVDDLVKQLEAAGK